MKKSFLISETKIQRQRYRGREYGQRQRDMETHTERQRNRRANERREECTMHIMYTQKFIYSWGGNLKTFILHFTTVL